ncbi:hypothetical protein AN640_05590 [Candidatus Epulonipiscium fishelsonii]|uniref:Uncharacterized protein n=1 Tax=Candidatus Epulonipiscium fishelsonii TaxID=77094 RepID=A0ACC8XI95_9FIRM|nr:hypothetical protein AN640_05590 [Epulopiscium sp. SCG-D08WGA-EpuloA1]
MSRLLKKSLFIVFVLSSTSTTIYSLDNFNIDKFLDNAKYSIDNFDVDKLLDNGSQFINSISTSIKSLVFNEESVVESDISELTETVDDKITIKSLDLDKPLSKTENTTTTSLNTDKIESNISELIKTSIDNGVDISELMQDEALSEENIYPATSTTEAALNVDFSEKYCIGNVINSGNGDGYFEQNIIDNKDPHYGWKLGNFYISDFTDEIKDAAGNPIFLKTIGNSVTLNFQLEQNINKLNNLDNLTIQEDKNGYHTNFGVTESNLGRGTLMIKYTDYQNKTNDPIIYTNFLPAINTNADTQIELQEEGDYEVSFNYRIKNDPRIIFGVSILPTYHDYSINFKFSIRNGNCMVFPYDLVTKNELANKSFTENGFYLDLANSHYLNVSVKKEIVTRVNGSIVEDVRFDRPVKVNEEFVDEGIYTVTIENPYTNQKNIKQIYIEPDNLLKAHASQLE